MSSNCYEKHAKMLCLEDDQFKGALLVHGTIWHPVSGTHGHSWLEKSGVVIDTSSEFDVMMATETYYALGSVTDTKKYTREEASKLMLQHENYGPWD